MWWERFNVYIKKMSFTLADLKSNTQARFDEVIEGARMLQMPGDDIGLLRERHAWVLGLLDQLAEELGWETPLTLQNNKLEQLLRIRLQEAAHGAAPRRALDGFLDAFAHFFLEQEKVAASQLLIDKECLAVYSETPATVAAMDKDRLRNFQLFLPGFVAIKLAEDFAHQPES